MNPVPLFLGYYEHGDIILNYYISMLWTWSLANYVSTNIYRCFLLLWRPTSTIKLLRRLYCKTTTAIIEAFSVIKTWNPTWDPKWFMVDKCDKDIKSLGNIFLRTYMNCFNILVLIKNLFIEQNIIHFWKPAKKYQEWFGFGLRKFRNF